MGNDGGTIAKKQDLLSLYSRDALSANHQMKLDDDGSSKYNTCAVSSLPLHDAGPVLSDRNGKLYLKEKVLELLVEQKLHGKQNGGLSRIKSMHDLVELNIAWTSAADSAESMTISCPVTQSRGPFAYLRSCGCVMGYKLLQELAQAAEQTEDACPLCETTFNFKHDIVVINPTNDPKYADTNNRSFAELSELQLSHSKRPLRKKSKKSKKSKKLKESDPKVSESKESESKESESKESKDETVDERSKAKETASDGPKRTATHDATGTESTEPTKKARSA